MQSLTLTPPRVAPLEQEEGPEGNLATLVCAKPGGAGHLRVEAFDKNLVSADTLLATGNIDVCTAMLTSYVAPGGEFGGRAAQWFPLTLNKAAPPVRQGAPSPRVCLSFGFVAAPPSDPAALVSAASDADLLPTAGLLEVDVSEAINLASQDWFGKNDPFVTAALVPGGLSKPTMDAGNRTRTKEDSGARAVWNQTLVLPCFRWEVAKGAPARVSQSLMMRCMDEDMMVSDRCSCFTPGSRPPLLILIASQPTLPLPPCLPLVPTGRGRDRTGASGRGGAAACASQSQSLRGVLCAAAAAADHVQGHAQRGVGRAQVLVCFHAGARRR